MLETSEHSICTICYRFKQDFLLPENVRVQLVELNQVTNPV